MRVGERGASTGVGTILEGPTPLGHYNPRPPGCLYPFYRVGPSLSAGLTLPSFGASLGSADPLWGQLVYLRPAPSPGHLPPSLLWLLGNLSYPEACGLRRLTYSLAPGTGGVPEPALAAALSAGRECDPVPLELPQNP